MNLEILATSMTVGKKTAPNRIVNHPMECNDADSSGNPTDLTLKRYQDRFRGYGPHRVLHGLRQLQPAAEIPSQGRVRCLRPVLQGRTSTDKKGQGIGLHGVACTRKGLPVQMPGAHNPDARSDKSRGRVVDRIVLVQIIAFHGIH